MTNGKSHATILSAMDKKRAQRIGQRIKELRQQRDWTQEDLAQRSGLSREYISNVERAIQEGPGLKQTDAIAAAFGISAAELLPIDKPRSVNAILSEAQAALQRLELVEIPLRGTVPAGTPLPGLDASEGIILVPREILSEVSKIDEVYGLRVKGESLAGDNIHDGVCLVIDPNAPFVDGDIYHVLVGSEEVLKHVYKENGHYRLKSSNGHYQDLYPTDGRILGRKIAKGSWDKD